MNKQEVMQQIETLLDESKAAVLATVSADGKPHMRWMTPFVLSRWPNVVFAITSPTFPKILDLGEGNQVEWLVQSKSLDRIINIRGAINVQENPSLKAQIMEALGHRFAMFWKVNDGSTDFVVLETVVDEVSLFTPMKGVREHVDFRQRGV